jgi:hypothetical protein
MGYFGSMSGNDRREFQRLRLAKPILALFDGQNALILDIGISGAFVEHYGEPSTGDRFTLHFRWKGTDVEFLSEVEHSMVVRTTASSPVSHSGLKFVQSIGEAESRLNDMMATFVGKILAAQRANAGATQPSDAVALEDLGGARRSRTRGFVTYRLRAGVWSRILTDSSRQPADGFTVAGYEDDEELESLCRAWEAADGEGRRLIQLVAELSSRTVKRT